MANTNELNLAALLQKVAALETKLDGLLTLAKTPSGSKGKKSKAKADGEAKPRAPSSWNLFIKRVSLVLQGDGQKATGLMAFCGHLKATNEAYLDLEDDDILLARASWTPPETKPKEAKPKEEKPKEPKPKPPMSDAHKEAMAEGRRKAAAKRKAEKEAAAAGASEPESEPEPPKAPSPKPVVAKSEELKRMPFKGSVYLMDPTTGGMWLRKADGTKGEWKGKLKDGKLDVTVAEP